MEDYIHLVTPSYFLALGVLVRIVRVIGAKHIYHDYLELFGVEKRRNNRDNRVPPLANIKTYVWLPHRHILSDVE